jgi:hypothetical protein
MLVEKELLNNMSLAACQVREAPISETNISMARAVQNKTTSVLLEIVVHDLNLSRTHACATAAVAIQFLDYPLVTILPETSDQDASNGSGAIRFDKGKSCRFEANIPETRDLLQKVGPGDTQLPASQP